MTDLAEAEKVPDPIIDKGLKGGALGLISSTIVGVASTAPAYSLAATLGFVVIDINGLQAPIITILAFVPMLFISYAYKELNNADPDCGTTFTWGTRAFGPKTGWLGGWGIVAADLLVMASLAQIAGQYVFLLFNANGDRQQRQQRLGPAGRRHVDRRDDGHLLRRDRDLGQLPEGAARHRADHAPGALRRGAGTRWGPAPRRSGTSRPRCRGSTRSTTSPASASWPASLLMLFIYWGWDTAVSVNEETKDPHTTPGPGRRALHPGPPGHLRASSSWPRSPTPGSGRTASGCGNPANAGDVLSVLGQLASSAPRASGTSSPTCCS